MPDRGWRGRANRGGHEDERLSALLDDELTEDDAIRVARHVADCDRCLEELHAVRRAREALRALPAVDPPPALYGDILVAATVPHERHRVAARLVVAAAASLALVAGASFLLGDEPRGTVAPPVEVFVVDHVARVDGGPMIMPIELRR